MVAAFIPLSHILTYFSLTHSLLLQAQAGGAGAGAAPAGGAAGGGNLDFLRTNPQFQALRQIVQANPQILQPMLQVISSCCNIARSLC